MLISVYPLKIHPNDIYYYYEWTSRLLLLAAVERRIVWDFDVFVLLIDWMVGLELNCEVLKDFVILFVKRMDRIVTVCILINELTIGIIIGGGGFIETFWCLF